MYVIGNSRRERCAILLYFILSLLTKTKRRLIIHHESVVSTLQTKPQKFRFVHSQEISVIKWMPDKPTSKCRQQKPNQITEYSTLNVCQWQAKRNITQRHALSHTHKQLRRLQEPCQQYRNCATQIPSCGVWYAWLARWRGSNLTEPHNSSFCSVEYPLIVLFYAVLTSRDPTLELDWLTIKVRPKH